MADQIIRKSTDELLKELEGSEEFTRFLSANREQFVDQTLSKALTALLQKKGLTKAQVFQKAQMSEDYGYQIFSGLRQPTRGKLLMLAIGMGLDLAETQDLLKAAGFAPLYAKNEIDCAILYGIVKKQSVMQINDAVFDLSQKTLEELR